VIDWPDIIKVGGGFLGGIITALFGTWLKERAERRSANFKKRQQFVDEILPLIDAAVVGMWKFFNGNRRDPNAEAEAMLKIDDLYGCIRLNEVYLPEDVATLLHQLHRQLRHHVIYVNVHADNRNENEQMRAERIRVMTDAAKALETDIPALRKQIEQKFREMLA
jgi:hypothetical protein